jgi:carbon-monoxide dehydrogenase small subunit
MTVSRGREATREIRVTVNGQVHELAVPVRKTLLDVLREDLGLTGTHAGCEHGICGCCNVLLDGQGVRSCLMFAVQADGHELTTVEGLARDGELHPLQRAFAEHHALQCGYCTPGMLIAAHELLEQNASPTEREIREAIAGNLCRCTGYVQIVEAIAAAARDLAAARGTPVA